MMWKIIIINLYNRAEKSAVTFYYNELKANIDSQGNEGNLQRYSNDNRADPSFFRNIANRRE